jgi:Raf kinase inhibitor-like YbhB/YbcL family protein
MRLFSLALIAALTLLPKFSFSEPESLQLSSPAFSSQGMIPALHTCDGADISPPLRWEGVPEDTRSFALIMEDPDAPTGTWVHWVIYNIPPDTRELSQKIVVQETLPDGFRQAMTDFRRLGYGGPCPPSGTHRYFFRLFALDDFLDLEPDAEKGELLEAMKGHVIARGELIGLYMRGAEKKD